MSGRACRLVLALLLVLPLALSVSFPAQAQQGTALPGVAGGELGIQSLESGDAVVVFWASWSPRCRDVDQTINQISARWGGRARVVSVSFQEDAPAVRAFLAERRINVPTYLDSSGSFSKRHGVSTLPSLLVLSAGQVAFKGRLPADYQRVIEEGLGGSR